ncbi:hypothetical protein PHYPSEUDO_007722 [Phytophthora pseudosyringae]|uniref:Uncharacterized protein n=1 Tax=Phytophthora pseudosyringae TaxID=221518 RepID=A0A8T1WAY9_9STRA|nr:hypothetical protein PHYPSEUDO_007722 [Phytophthora pseudosyringae]
MPRFSKSDVARQVHHSLRNTAPLICTPSSATPSWTPHCIPTKQRGMKTAKHICLHQLANGRYCHERCAQRLQFGRQQGRLRYGPQLDHVLRVDLRIPVDLLGFAISDVPVTNPR